MYLVLIVGLALVFSHRVGVVLRPAERRWKARPLRAWSGLHPGRRFSRADAELAEGRFHVKSAASRPPIVINVASLTNLNLLYALIKHGRGIQ
ncbi:hypothetical protein [Nocardia yunnanensis]|uniref:hypothetical protein n=1 Tax=Nocardia yunnanensis TaxID=2382165 RepID=UPI0013C5142C|nr:hypothetical protein [Nocardia yunnanensis]